MNNGIKSEDVDFNTLSVRAKKSILRILKQQFNAGGMLYGYGGSKLCKMLGCGVATRDEIRYLVDNYEKRNTSKNIWVE